MRVYGEVRLGRRGGAFVEVLVSLSLTAGAVMALLASITGMNRVHHAAQEINDFSELAEARVEAFRMASATGSADTISLVPGGSLTSSVLNYADTAVTPDGRTFVRRWTVAAGPAAVRTVVVRVEAAQGHYRDFPTQVASP